MHVERHKHKILNLDERPEEYLTTAQKDPGLKKFMVTMMLRLDTMLLLLILLTRYLTNIIDLISN